jgi:isoamylase
MIRRSLPMLRRGRFLTGAYDEELGVLLDGRAQETGIRRVGSDSTLLIILNAHTEIVPFTLPAALGGSRWVRLIDSSDPDGEALALRDFGHAFQRVFQAMDDAATKSLRFGFDQETVQAD